MKKVFYLMIVLLVCACTSKLQQDVQSGTMIPLYGTQPMDIELKQKQKPVKAGMLLPLSGKYASLGDDLRNAAFLALFEVSDENFQLAFYDTKGTPEGAKEAFQKARQEDVEVILGPVFAQEVEKIASLSRWYNIPVISFTSDNSSLGNGVYSLALTIQNQTQRIIQFACARGTRRLAIMAPDNKAGDIAIDIAQKTARSCDIDIAHLSVYNPKFINFEPYVTATLPEEFVRQRKNHRQLKKDLRSGRVKQDKTENLQDDEQESEQPLTIAEQLDFDALFIADDGNRLKAISSLFGLYDVTPDDVLFLGLSTWNDATLSKEGSLKNAYYPVLPTKEYKVFANKFNQTYGKAPNRLASLAYDSVALAFFLTRQDNWQKVMENNQDGYFGTDGSFRFNKDGTVERLLGIYQIKRTATSVERPSRTFAEEDERKAQMLEIRQLNLSAVSEEVDFTTTTEVSMD